MDSPIVITCKGKSTMTVINEIKTLNEPKDKLIQINYWNGNVSAVTIKQALKELNGLLSDEKAMEY